MRLNEGLRMAILQSGGGEPQQPPTQRSEYEVYMSKAQDRRAHIERSRGETGEQR